MSGQNAISVYVLLLTVSIHALTAHSIVFHEFQAKNT